MTNWITLDESVKARKRAIQVERERIIKLLVEADTTNLTAEELKGWYFAIAFIKGETR